MNLEPPHPDPEIEAANLIAAIDRQRHSAGMAPSRIDAEEAAAVLVEMRQAVDAGLEFEDWISTLSDDRRQMALLLLLPGADEYLRQERGQQS